MLCAVVRVVVCMLLRINCAHPQSQKLYAHKSGRRLGRRHTHNIYITDIQSFIISGQLVRSARAHNPSRCPLIVSNVRVPRLCGVGLRVRDARAPTRRAHRTQLWCAWQFHSAFAPVDATTTTTTTATEDMLTEEIAVGTCKHKYQLAYTRLHSRSSFFLRSRPLSPACPETLLRTLAAAL